MSFYDLVRNHQKSKMKELESVFSPSDLVLTDLESRKRLLGVPRASQLYTSCMRMYVISYMKKIPIKDYTNFNQRLTFNLGHAVHYWVQNDPFLFGSRRRGLWKCAACGYVMGFGPPPVGKCPECSAYNEALQYYEYPFEVKRDLFLTGHTDMFLQTKYRKLPCIIDLKTISQKQFPSLEAPKIEAEWQVQAYMWACSQDEYLSHLVDHELGFVIYISKGWHNDMLPVKTFPVYRNDSMLGRIKEKLKKFADGIKSYPNNIPEPLPICVNTKWDHYTSKQCQLRLMCRGIHEGGDFGKK